MRPEETAQSAHTQLKLGVNPTARWINFPTDSFRWVRVRVRRPFSGRVQTNKVDLSDNAAGGNRAVSPHPTEVGC